MKCARSAATALITLGIVLAGCDRKEAVPASSESPGAGAVIVSGELTYRARIALPPDSRAVVELLGASPPGSVVTDRVFDLEGKQVPVPFRLSVERALLTGEQPYTFQGAIYSQGLPIWISEELPVDLSAAAVELGSLELQRFAAEQTETEWNCGDQVVTVTFADDAARLRVGEDIFALRRVPTASGAKYEAIDDASMFVWNKGPQMTFSMRGESHPDCARIDREASAFRARGNEPGWAVTIGADELELVTQYGEVTTTVPAPEPQVTGERMVYQADTERGPLAVTIVPGPCIDSMSGMPYPRSVTVEFAGATLQGCGGEPRELLLGDEWVVDSVAGEPVKEARITLAFDTDGRVAGSAACNTYTSAYALSGEGLSFTKAAVTMKACAPELMQQEDRFLDVLGDVARFEMVEAGQLALHTADGRVIKAHRS